MAIGVTLKHWCSQIGFAAGTVHAYRSAISISEVQYCVDNVSNAQFVVVDCDYSSHNENELCQVQGPCRLWIYIGG